MAKAQKKDKSLSKSEILDEIKKLAERAKETSSHQLGLIPNEDLGDEDIDTGFDIAVLKDTANPDESYRLYYGMRRLLMDNLPKGKKNKKLRQYVYDEKNLFLNRGAAIKEDGTRGSDGRMTYINPFLSEAFGLVANWIQSGANAFDIYMAFYNVNEERGYHKPTEDAPKGSFDLKLKALLNVPPPNKENA